MCPFTVSNTPWQLSTTDTKMSDLERRTAYWPPTRAVSAEAELLAVVFVYVSRHWVAAGTRFISNSRRFICYDYIMHYAAYASVERGRAADSWWEGKTCSINRFDAAAVGGRRASGAKIADDQAVVSAMTQSRDLWRQAPHPGPVKYN